VVEVLLGDGRAVDLGHSVARHSAAADDDRGGHEDGAQHHEGVKSLFHVPGEGSDGRIRGT
jgi:hypothetical protein